MRERQRYAVGTEALVLLHIDVDIHSALPVSGIKLSVLADA